MSVSKTRKISFWRRTSATNFDRNDRKQKNNHTCALTDTTPSKEPPSSPQGCNTRYKSKSDNEIIPITLSLSSTTTSL